MLEPLNTNSKRVAQSERTKLERVAWSTGNLYYLADNNQEELIKALEEKYDGRYKEIAWNCVRRMGKSFALCLFAYMQCLKKPGTDVKYLAPNKNMVGEIINPQFDYIMEQCPDALRNKCVPSWNEAKGKYTFPNGSTITVAGCSKRTKNALRGRATNIGIIDEAGFVDSNEILKSMVESVLRPAIIERKGIFIMASTPADTPGHYFVEFAVGTEVKGNYFKRTVYQTPRYDEYQIAEIIESYGSNESIPFRREYLCEFIVDLDKSVTPEFTIYESDLIKTVALTKPSPEEILKGFIQRPVFIDRYIAMDYGFSRNFTGVLFGYWDFPTATIVIEDELLLKPRNSQDLSEAIKKKQKEIWGEEKVWASFIDAPGIHTADLNTLHGLQFRQTKKTDKEASINVVNLNFRDKKLLINSKCKELIRQLKTAVFVNSNKDDFALESNGGHYDLVDALIYMVRNVNRTRNPIPYLHGIDLYNSVNYQKEKPISEQAQRMKNVFGR